MKEKPKYEIVEFYPIKNHPNKKIIGSIQIYFTEFDADLRNIYVLKIGTKYYFRLPFGRGIDPETNELVQFPIFSFTDRIRTQEIIDFLIEKGTEYINNYLKEKV